MILIGFLVFAGLLKFPVQPEVDTVAVNEIAKQAANNMDDLTKMEEAVYKYRYFIIDNDGRVLFSSDTDLPGNMQSAIKQGFLPVDIQAGKEVYGKALVEIYPDNHFSQAQTRLSTMSVIVFALLCALIAATSLILYFNVIKPFWRLESFAHKISNGKFDEPLPLGRNNIFGLFTQSFDVMRESLKEARQNQLAAERAQKELIASLNHDIKTPITSIKLYSELLQAEGNLDPAVMEKLNVIDAKADLIDRMMNDMLRSTLEELGELKANLSPADSRILTEMFADTGYHSKIILGDVPSCLIEIDPVRMEQVIGNILANSNKYAGTDINVTFRQVQDFLQIDISDFGAGVDPADLELICTKFYRGENAINSQKEGEGLGLYIASQLMKKMRGELEAYNTKDGFGVKLLVRLSH
jgi:signal transduction histidine kinase